MTDNSEGTLNQIFEKAAEYSQKVISYNKEYGNYFCINTTIFDFSPPFLGEQKNLPQVWFLSFIIFFARNSRLGSKCNYKILKKDTFIFITKKIGPMILSKLNISIILIFLFVFFNELELMSSQHLHLSFLFHHNFNFRFPIKTSKGI